MINQTKKSNLLGQRIFSHENYKIGINKYKSIPIIFPKEIFNINKFKDQMSYSLMIYKNKNNIEENKKLTNLGKFHSFTDKSMYKNIYLCWLLTTIAVQTGFKTKHNYNN